VRKVLKPEYIQNINCAACTLGEETTVNARHKPFEHFGIQQLGDSVAARFDLERARCESRSQKELLNNAARRSRISMHVMPVKKNLRVWSRDNHGADFPAAHPCFKLNLQYAFQLIKKNKKSQE
jgi:hypothetical protein